MWNPSPFAFRLIVIVSLIINCALLIDGHWRIIPRSEEAALAQEQMNGLEARFSDDQWTRAYYVGHAGTIAALLGMLLFIDIARWTALMMPFINLAFCPFFGLYVSTELQVALGYLAALLYDAALAIAFLAPIAYRFTGDDDGRLPTVSAEEP